jgi:hypothetical protein
MTARAGVKVGRFGFVLMMNAPLREFASAIALAVKSQLFRALHRELETLELLEVDGKKGEGRR